MPRLTKSLPKISRHKGSGQAYITLHGEHITLGRYGSKIAQSQYDRIIAEWLANGRQLPADESQAVTMNAVFARYLKFARIYYVKDGKTTNEVTAIKNAIKIASHLYGRLPAEEFGPLKLEAIQRYMVDHSMSRKYINKQISRLKRCLKWAASKEIIPADVAESAKTLTGLKKGRCEAREHAPVTPVDDATVDATLQVLGNIVADMVRVQRWTGCRPSEVCDIRPCDIDRTGDIWIYIPAHHKTEHHGKLRKVFVGPRSQSVLGKYLSRPPESFCFDPREAEGARKNSKHKYARDSYGRAVRRAVHRINRSRDAESQLELWSPNRLRHARATEVRKEFGIEGSQVTLGHSKADVTQIYAERDDALALRVAKETG